MRKKIQKSEKKNEKSEFFMRFGNSCMQNMRILGFFAIFPNMFVIFLL